MKHLEFGKVVLMESVLRNDIVVRFLRKCWVSLVWKRLGKRKISCFWSGHRVWCTCFWKFMKALKEVISARPVWKTGDVTSLSKYRRMTQGAVYSASYKPFLQGNDKIENSTRNIIKITIKEATIGPLIKAATYVRNQMYWARQNSNCSVKRIRKAWVSWIWLSRIIYYGRRWIKISETCWT